MLCRFHSALRPGQGEFVLRQLPLVESQLAGDISEVEPVVLQIASDHEPNGEAHDESRLDADDEQEYGNGAHVIVLSVDALPASFFHSDVLNPAVEEDTPVV